MNRTIVSVAGWLRTKPLLGRLALRCLPDITRTIQVRSIGPLRIRLRRNRSFWLRDPIEFEGRMFGIFQRLVRPGDVCYDVGANMGLYVRAFAGPFKAGTVVAFEPMRENLELLRQNIALADDPAKIRLIEAALSDRDGEELLQVDDVMTSSAALDRVTGGRPSTGREQYGLPALTETVKVARLDTIVEQEHLPPPHLIKIDIEGGELLMLRGAIETLRRHRPILVMEMHDLELTRQVLQLLDENGYHVFAEIPDGGQQVHRQVHASDVDGRTNPYDIHHILAATDPSLIRDPIPPFTPAS